MPGQLKRLVPSPVKSGLRSVFDVCARGSGLGGQVQILTREIAELRARLAQHEQSLMAHGQELRQNQQLVGELRQSVQELQSWVLELKPEIYLPPETVRHEVGILLARHGVPSERVNLNVSKNDVMFQFMAREFVVRLGRSIPQAFAKYVMSGLHMWQVLEAILVRKFGTLSEVQSILDFASGYGRLSRFLVLAFDPARVWVSDIKERTVEFQRREFGVQGFASTEAPEDLTVDKRFDCIFVGSLFSHLPEATFGRWLQRLCELLNPTGLLIFSVHDASLIDRPAGDFTYRQISEEVHARSADGQLDTSQYGVAYVSEAFVRRVIEGLAFENRRYFRFERALWTTQDVYALSRDRAFDLSGLTLPQVLAWTTAE